MGNTVQPMRSSFANADLVVCVLTSLPDFHCLASTILTSKTIYNVFQQHPRSIVRSVAYNLVGPALPQALRFVRCQNLQLYSKPVGELLGDDDIQKNPVLSSEDIRSLVAISNSVQGLESLFSWRVKDRRFKTSQLSLAESTRFQKAMYRLCLFSTIYGRNAYDLALEDNSDEMESVLEEAQALRKGFFGSFSTPELREIQRVETFLREILTRAGDVLFSAIPPVTSHIISLQGSYVLYCAPHNILDVYKEGLDCILDEDFHDTDENFFHDFMIGPLTSVLVDRKEPCILPVDQKQPIIDEVIGEHDRCSQCESDTVQGLDLWGPSNWSYLWGSPPLHSIAQLLKGYLSTNIADKAHFMSVVRETSSEQLIGGLFDYKAPAYDTWNKEDWLCQQCLEKFMRDHLHIWYLGQKVKRGHAIPDNCWYGYNCRTQTHRPAHAQKLNHWCEPIKGDTPLT